MRKMKANKKYLAGIAAVALLVAGVKIPSLYAANAIEADKDCSLTVQVEDTADYGEDLKNASIDVKVYKIADMAQTGAFTSTKDFADLKVEDVKPGEEDWQKTAQDAEKIVEDKKLNADGEFNVENGSGMLKTLSHGLYLVEAADTNTENYTYKFNPYIISLPDNLYYQSGDAKDDAWIYDVTTGLKPERENRYGSLKIVKTLQEFNSSLKEATFVFSVEGKDKDGNVVYSNVASTTFDGAGTKEAVLDKIPAGAELTITEVYSGASYKLTSDETQTGTVVADETIEADFSNTYNNELKPGYGVTNHFEYSEDDGWKWSQQKDNTVAQ